jgi:hypothetical protein
MTATTSNRFTCALVTALAASLSGVVGCSGGDGQSPVGRSVEPQTELQLAPCTVFTIPEDYNTWCLGTPYPWGTFTGSAIDDLGLSFVSSDNSAGNADLSVDVDGARVLGVVWGTEIGGTVSNLSWGSHTLTATAYEINAMKTYTYSTTFTMLEPSGGGGGGGCNNAKRGCE